MCGRFDQNQTPAHYAAALDWPVDANTSSAAPRFNVAPGTARPLLHVRDGRHRIDDVYWGYRAHFAAGRIPVAINARLEKLDKSYWRGLFARGRALVGADGWYEWTGEKGHKQPWHLHLKSRAPLFMAALCGSGPVRDNPAEAGFVIVTDDAAGGMVDIHDRRPLVLEHDDARLWLDPACSPQRALLLARQHALPASEFEWYPVSREIGRAGNDGAYLSEPRA